MSKTFAEWYAVPENRERHKANMRKRYADKPQEYRDRATAWNKNHPERREEIRERSKAKKNLPEAPGPGIECES